MGEGITNQYREERDKARRQLEAALNDNRFLRQLLAEIRPVLITNKHKRAVDVTLATRPSQSLDKSILPGSHS